MTTERVMRLVLGCMGLVGCGAEDLAALPPEASRSRAAPLRSAAPAEAGVLPALPGGWRTASFGASAALGGGSSFDGSRYLVTGGGGDFWGGRDRGTMIYREVSGDFDLVARLDSYAGDTSDGGAKGLLVFKEYRAGRGEPTDSGAGVFQAVSYDDPERWYVRATAGSSIASYRSTHLNDVGGPVWLRLTRAGNVFRSFHRDVPGGPWVQHNGSRTVALRARGYVGLAATSRRDASVATVRFSDIWLRGPGTAGPIVSDVRVSGVTRHEALLSFRTDVQATSTIEYDLSTWPKVATEAAPTTSHAVPLDHLMSGAAHGYRISVTDGSGRWTIEPERSFATEDYAHDPLPDSWHSHDVGAVSMELPGSAWYDGAADGGTFVVRGTGTDVYHTADSFHFVYLPVSGDFDLTLKVAGWSGYLHMWSKAMTMFRADLTPGSAMFNQSLNYSGLDYLYYRDVADAPQTDVISSQLNPGEGTPVWARLRRVGDAFVESYSSDGVRWRVHGPVAGTTVALPESGYVGFGVCSKSDSYQSEIIYSDVSLRTP